MHGGDLVSEAQRQLAICNACRYCEGYCAVFPALERRTILESGDIAYLANLCHDCRACFQACPYTPPHEFAVNIPLLMSEARVATYESYAIPKRLAAAFQRSGRYVATLSAVGLLLVLVAATVSGNLRSFISNRSGSGSFYRVVPHLAMSISFLVISVYVIVVLVAALVAFWRDTNGSLRTLLDLGAWARATWESLSGRYLGGGGGGCYYPDRTHPSGVRRVIHSLVVYGFLFAFIATVVANLEQTVFDRVPPFGVVSAPVLFGLVGGFALMSGTSGLLWLKIRSEKGLGVGRSIAMDYAFLVSLDLVTVTGLLTLALRSTTAMAAVLTIHLAVLVGFYLTIPYGKFVHAVYRFAALVQNGIESRTVT